MNRASNTTPEYLKIQHIMGHIMLLHKQNSVVEHFQDVIISPCKQQPGRVKQPVGNHYLCEWYYTVWVKKIRPLRFSDIFSQAVGNFKSIFYTPLLHVHIYILFNCLQFWRRYAIIAILSETTHRIFDILLELNL